MPLPPAMSQLPEFDEESQFQNNWIPPTIAVETSTPPTILETCNANTSAKSLHDVEDCYGDPITKSKGTIDNSLKESTFSNERDLHEGSHSTGVNDVSSSVQQVSAASQSVAVNALSTGDPTGSATPSQAAVENGVCIQPI